MSNPRLGRILSAALALGILLALRLPTLSVPIINVDEADFAVEAGVLLDGGRPYVDFVEKKPPLIYAGYAAALAMVGRYNLPGLRLLMLGYVLVTALFLAAIARRIHGERASWIAAPAYALMVSAGPPLDVHAANAETFFLLPLLVGTWLSLPRQPGTPSPTPRALFAAGVCIGVASLFKQQAGMQLPILLGFLLSRPAGDTAPAAVHASGRRRVLAHPNVRAALALLGGFGAIWALTVAVLAAVGALGEFYYWTVEVNRYYIANGNNLHDSVARFRRVLLMLASFAPLVWIAGACGLVFHLAKDRWRNVLLPVWLVASLVPIVLGGRFFPHYFLQLYPPLVLLAAGLLAHLWDRLPPWPAIRVTRVVVALGLAALLGARLESKMTRLIDPEVVSFPHATPRARALARYVREHTAPDARILVWGYGSALYHLAQRRPATRFPYVTYLVGAVEGTPTWWSPFHPSRPLEIPRAWNLFFQDLDRHPPELVIDTASAGYFAFQKFPVEKYPGLMRILDAGYQRTVIEGFAVWQRRASPAPAGLAATP
jgi:hypothetical protein